VREGEGGCRVLRRGDRGISSRSSRGGGGGRVRDAASTRQRRDNRFPATQFTVSNQKQIAVRTRRACVRLTNARDSPDSPRLRKIMTSATQRRVWVTSSFRDGRSRFALGDHLARVLSRSPFPAILVATPTRKRAVNRALFSRLAISRVPLRGRSRATAAEAGPCQSRSRA